MRILVDSHVALWWLEGNESMGSEAMALVTADGAFAPYDVDIVDARH